MTNNSLDVLSIFGTRPEAIKMAPLVKRLENDPYIKSTVAVTAQHREMLNQVLDLFEIGPDYDLNIMKARQSLTEITSEALEGLDDIIKELAPGLVLVHGDTTTTFAAALAAFYNKASVGHVEAGLRTNNRYIPFPEEMNRRLVSVISELNFAPTIDAYKNLINEGANRENIFITGNTVIDSMQISIESDYSFNQPELNRIFRDPVFNDKKKIVLEAHRRENWGDPLKEICLAVKELVLNNEELVVIFPVHKNPVVRETVEKYLYNLERVFLIDPLDVGDFHNLMFRSYLILTDSGGIQEEAPSLGVPVVVLREKTERPEALKAGTVLLAGTDKSKILELTTKLINDKAFYNSVSKVKNPYGDGKAADRIIGAIKYYFKYSEQFPEEWSYSE